MGRFGGIFTLLMCLLGGCTSSTGISQNFLSSQAVPDSVLGIPERSASITVANAIYGLEGAFRQSSSSYPCDIAEFKARKAEREAARVFDVFPQEKFEEALREVNAFRRANGLKPLRMNTELAVIAEDHLRDLAGHDLVSHDGSDGSTLGTRLRRGGYLARIAAENLSGGHDTYHEAVHAWIDSPNHRKNLLLEDVTQIGMAAIYEDNTRYGTFWAMVLAKPLDDKDMRVARWR